MKVFSLIAILAAQFANAQTNEALPQMMLGRGVVTKLTKTDDTKEAKKQAKEKLEVLKYDQRSLVKGLKDTGDEYFKKKLEENKAAQEEILSVINETEASEPSAKLNYFVGFECVGKDNQGNLNCFKVQPVLVDLLNQKTIARGEILLIGDHTLSTTAQPTDAQIKVFMKEFKRNFTRYKRVHMTDWQKAKQDLISLVLIPSAAIGLPIVAIGAGSTLLTSAVLFGGGIGLVFGFNLLEQENVKVTNNSEQTDTRGFGWATKPKKLSTKKGTLFQDFILQYHPLNCIEIPSDSLPIDEKFGGSKQKEYMADCEAKKAAEMPEYQKKVAAPFPVY